MLYKIGKKTFNFLINFMHFCQICLIFLAFFTTLYWLLQLAEVGWVTNFAGLFEPIKNFVHLFYTRTVTVDEATVDFSFLVGSFLMLGIVWGLKFLIANVETIEKKYDRIHWQLKNKEEEIFNTNLELEYKDLEHRNNKFAVIIKFDARDLKKDSFYEKEVNIGVEEQAKKAIETFSNSLTPALKTNKKSLDDKIFLYFNNIETVDSILIEIDKNIKATQAKYKEEGWEINFCEAVEVYSNEKELAEKCKILLLLVKLNLKKEILCAGTFRQRYLLLKNNKWTIEGKGIYKINEEEEVFSLKLK